MPTDMKLPELGENIEGGDVLRVMVNVGDAIKKDQPVLELETDKATIEVPSSLDGVVKEIKVKAGQKAKVGQTTFVIEEGQAESKEQESKERRCSLLFALRSEPSPNESIELRLAFPQCDATFDRRPKRQRTAALQDAVASFGNARYSARFWRL